MLFLGVSTGGWGAAVMERVSCEAPAPEEEDGECAPSEFQMDSDEDSSVTVEEEEEHFAMVARVVVCCAAVLLFTREDDEPHFSHPNHFSEHLLHMLQSRHSRRFLDAYGVSSEFFLDLVEFLEIEGTPPNIPVQVTAPEKLALFLLWARSGASVQEVASKHGFARSTVRLCIKQATAALASHFETYVRLPSHIPELMHDDPRFRPLRGAIGAIDGCLCPLNTRMLEARRVECFRDRKGRISTNLMAISSLNHRYTLNFLCCGCEGRASDSGIWNVVQRHITLPDGAFLLGDAGFPLVKCRILTPYLTVRYHLKEWAESARHRPCNKKELFNLRHAQLRCEVEQSFGIWKRRFKIIQHPPEFYDLQEYARVILPSLAVLHNKIRQDVDEFEQHPELSSDVVTALEAIASNCATEEHICALRGVGGERKRAHLSFNSDAVAWRDSIADAMWDDYSQEMSRRGVEIEEDNETAEKIAEKLRITR